MKKTPQAVGTVPRDIAMGEMVSMRIEFFPEPGGEQVRVQREFVAAEADRERLIEMFRRFVDQCERDAEGRLADAGLLDEVRLAAGLPPDTKGD